MSRRIAPALAWTLAIAPAAVYGLWQLVVVLQDPNAHDWKAYVLAAEALFDGRSPYASWQLAGPYGLGDLDKPFAFVYPPSALVAFAPFLATFELWTVANIALFVAGMLAVVARTSGLYPAPVALALWVAVLPPFLWDGVNGGGVTPALAGFLGLIYAGVPLAGLGAAIKLFPALWVGLPRGVGIRRTIVGFAVGFGVPAAISVGLAGLGPWSDWFVAFGNSGPACGRSLLSFACDGVPQPLLYGLGGAIFLASFRLPPAWALLALGLIPIVAAAQLWSHYFLTAAPGVVAVVLSLARSGQRPPAEAYVASAR